MKKFQFSLQTVLTYKVQVEEGLQNEHAILLQRVRQQEEALDSAIEQYKAYNREYRAAEQTGITILEAMTYESGLRFWEKEIERLREQLVACEQAAEKKRLEVVEARKETASLEKLKEHKLEDYQKQQEKQQEQFIDELVMTQRVMAHKLA